MKIALVISSQHAIPHGGVGQFVKTTSDLLMKCGHEVHILFDKKPKHNFLFSTGDRHFYPSSPLRSEQPTDRHKQGIDKAKIQNFKYILDNTAYENYDMYIINTSEAFDSVSQFNTNAKVLLYTHLFNQIFPEQSGKSVFTDEFVKHYNSFLYGSYTVATQSEFNKKRLISDGVKNCIILPMPITEHSLLESSQHIHKEGVLYIGTHSPGKNPTTYINVMKKLQLPCKVMTSPKSAKTFEQKFKKEGIKDYDIRVSITGEEKVNFIKSCKVFFNTSLFECYSYAFLECVGHMPVVVLEKQIWSDNFDEKFYHKVSTRNSGKKILELYNQPYNDDALEYVRKLDNIARTSWKSI